MAPSVAGRAAVCRLNLEAAPATVERYGIKSCPMVLVLKDGNEVKRLVGVCGEGAITDAVEASCTANCEGGKARWQIR